MIVAFDLMSWYRLKNNGNFPNASVGLFTEIEATVEYLIQLAYRSGLIIEDVLNHKGKNGKTLFWMAAYFSEKVAKMLLEKNVKVNTVDQKFMIPLFRVSNRL